MVIKFHVPFLRNMFSVQGLIYDNNASHDLSSFTVDCANGGNDKCAAETASKRNLSSLPTLLVTAFPTNAAICENRVSRTSGEVGK